MNRQTAQKRTLNIKGWYIVFMNALVGCGIAASFPQFSMTLLQLSEKTGISQGILMTSDTVKSAGIVLSMLISGFAYNRFGGRHIFIFALIVTLIPQFLIPHTSSVALLMLLKMVQGMASVIFPVFLVIILNWIEERDAGLSTAIFNGIFYAGGGIGGTLAGFVIAKSDWIASYYVLGIVQLCIGAIWLLTVKEAPPHKRRADAEKIAQKGDASRSRKLQDNAEALGSRKKDLMGSPILWLLAICFFATTWSVQAITVDWAIFGEWLGYDEFDLSKIMTAVTAGMILSCIFSGKISDFFCKRSTRKSYARLAVLMAGHLLIIASVCFLIFGDMRDFTLFYIATFLFTFASSWGLGAFYSILPEIYEEKTVPIATGITGGIGDLGMPAAPMAVGVFFGLRGFWDAGWASCAVIGAISFIAGFALLMILKKKRQSSLSDA